jgi:hypothetical protein
VEQDDGANGHSASREVQPSLRRAKTESARQWGMAAVEIPDDLLAALRADARARNLGDDPARLVVGFVRRHLADVCASGFDRDGLTGLGTREKSSGASWRLWS